jgi:hypothetical protein
MTPLDLPLDVLLMIAAEMTDNDGERCFEDLNAFLQVNRTLYYHLNPLLSCEAVWIPEITKRVLTQLLNTHNLERLKYFFSRKMPTWERFFPTSTRMTKF